MNYFPFTILNICSLTQNNHYIEPVLLNAQTENLVNLFVNVLTYIIVAMVFERFLKSLFIQIWKLLTVMLEMVLADSVFYHDNYVRKERKKKQKKKNNKQYFTITLDYTSNDIGIVI